uniref:Uncharacterized protein n=1 Tax=Setaria viridis TaxID=4556 RepID=A0A4V6D8Q6_SETVI|nr:hypothetical protein SEVIR_4G267000v2 [Setaria viridis]
MLLISFFGPSVRAQTQGITDTEPTSRLERHRCNRALGAHAKERRRGPSSMPNPIRECSAAPFQPSRAVAPLPWRTRRPRVVQSKAGL